MALTDDGEVWTTGVNDEGALGRETGVRNFPIQMRHLPSLDRMLACSSIT